MKSPISFLQNLKSEKGQILLFVMVVLLLLMVVVFAIIVNVRVDIRETQIEREYEKGYSSAEEEIFKISVDGFENWSSSIVANNEGFCVNVAEGESGWDYRNYCSEPDFDICCIVRGGSEGDKIVKQKTHNKIFGVSVKQDETLEVNLRGAQNGILSVNWETAPAMSIMLVCQAAGGEYSQIRAAVCRPNIVGDTSCGMPGTSGFWTISQAEANTVGPLNLSNCDPNATVLLRMRAIGADATNISVEHPVAGGLPPQMVELRAQGFPAGLTVENIEKGLPGPELQTLVPIDKRLPALFDYVLFVGDGSVSK